MIPYGYCHCGCGEKTTVARKTQASQGAVAGVPSRYRRGHQNRGVIAIDVPDRSIFGAFNPAVAPGVVVPDDR